MYGSKQKWMKLSKHKRGIAWHDVPRNMPTLVPPQCRTQMYYGDAGNLTGTVLGSLTWQAWACNDINDPDVTLTGHQPKFLDQFAQWYNKCLVMRSRIKVSMWNVGTDVTLEDLVGLGIQHYGMTQSGNFNNNLEDPIWGKRTAVLAGNALNPTNATSFQTQWDVLHESDATGMGYVDLIETGWSQGLTVAPLYKPEYHLWHVPPIGVVNNALLWRVEIVYDVLFYNPITVGIS